MEDNADETKLMGRRKALQVLGAGFVAASGLIALASCEKGGSSPAQPAPGAGAQKLGASNACQDKYPPDDAAASLRQTLQYMEQSNNPAKHCSICAQFEAGKYNECGGCKLFAGGVNPQGVCLSFAPLQAAPAAPGGAPAGASAKPGKPG